MKELLDKMQERMKYLESKEPKNDGMDEVEIKWRIRELTLAIIATQQELLEQMKTES